MSIADPYRRLTALLHLAPEQALDDRTRTEVLTEALVSYRALPSVRRDGLLRDLVRELVRADDLDLAEELVTSGHHDLEAAEFVVAALVTADQLDRATAFIGSATGPLIRARLAVTTAANLA